MMVPARGFLHRMRLRATDGSRQIFIFFTPAGIVFILFVIGIFMAGRFQTGGGGLPWILGIALIVAGLTGMIQTNDNLRGVEVARIDSEPVPAGETATIKVTLTNSSDTTRHNLRVRPASRKFWKISRPVESLETGGHTQPAIPLPASGRGVFPCPKLLVSTTYPLNICFAWKRFAPAGEIVVYPEPRGFPLHVFLKNEGMEANEAGAGGEEDVTGIRPFQSGDLPSRVDWRAAARTGKIMTRILESENAEIVLTWESTGFLPDTEDRLRQLSRWIDDCMSAGLRFRLQLGSASLLGRDQLYSCRKALAAFKDAGDSK